MVRFSRRRLMSLAAAGAFAAAAPRAVLAAAPTDRRFVLVLLRGGLDGLAAVPPYADKFYGDIRGALALPEPGINGGTLDLDGTFGLNPALAALHSFYAKGEMAVFHAVATPYRERSHFDGQDLLENGTEKPHAVEDGWLNRALGLMTSQSNGKTLGLAVGQSLPLAMRGATPVTSWAPVKMPQVAPDFLDKVADLYQRDPVFAQALASGLDNQAMFDEVLGDDGMEGSAMLGRKRGLALIKNIGQSVGQLLAQANGPRVAMLDVPGWDTHTNQGTDKGRLAPTLSALGEGIASLAQALGPAWRETAVLTLTEFGRTAHPNGTGATDHGTASVAFLLGGAVNGGRVIADWPGLDTGRLYEGRDLAPTLDTRAICKAILGDHLGLPAGDIDRMVFPGSADVAPLPDIVGA